jgi:hypothetical protein
MLCSHIAVSVAALIRKRNSPQRGEVPGIYPALWAAMAIVCGHSAVEVTMSMTPSLLYCFAVLGLISLCFGSEIEKKAFSTAVRVGSVAVTGVFAVLIALNMSANNMVRNAAGSTPTFFFSAAGKSRQNGRF